MAESDFLRNYRQAYRWFVNVGDIITVSGQSDKTTLPSGYTLYEGRRDDTGRQEVVLMKYVTDSHNPIEAIAVWEITRTSPIGNDILFAIKNCENPRK